MVHLLLLQVFASGHIPIVPLLPGKRLIRPIIPSFVQSKRAGYKGTGRSSRRTSHGGCFRQALSFKGGLRHVDHYGRGRGRSSGASPSGVSVEVQLRLKLLVPFQVGPIYRQGASDRAGASVDRRRPDRGRDGQAEPFPPSTRGARTGRSRAMGYHRLTDRAVSGGRARRAVGRLRLRSPCASGGVER